MQTKNEKNIRYDGKNVEETGSSSISSSLTSKLKVALHELEPTENSPLAPIANTYKKLVCTFRELPAWAQDNIYIHTGYRIPTNSYYECYKSLFYFHNESGNVYSHLVGAITFIVLAFTTSYYLAQHSEDLGELVKTSDWVVIYTFIGGAIACLLCSALFHLFCSHSEDVSKIWNRCDYFGIILLIIGSYIPATYYCFFCDEFWKGVYLGMIGILGAGTTVVCFVDKFRTPAYRKVRTSIFIFLGLSGLIPITHSLVRDGYVKFSSSPLISWLLGMAVFYLVGAFIYAYRIPERWFPGKFDYLFHSHQIFHVFVLTAAIFHYVGVIKAFYFHNFSLGGCLLV
jgi:adiponectin receptor